MMQLKNDQGLIGDSLGTVPVMVDLAKKYDGLQVQAHPESHWLYPLIAHHNIELVPDIDQSQPFLEIDIELAFENAMYNNLYMTQAYHQRFGMPTPNPAPRPQLEVPDVEVLIYDYIFAPFSRSTPTDQKWPIFLWEDLGRYFFFQGMKVCILGNSKHDSKFILPNGEPYYINEFDRPMVEVLNILEKSRKGCVSINTGISHLCFAMGTKNYLFNNQGQGWGVQPKSISIETYIPNISVDTMLEFIKNN